MCLGVRFGQHFGKLDGAQLETPTCEARSCKVAVAAMASPGCLVAVGETKCPRTTRPMNRYPKGFRRRFARTWKFGWRFRDGIATGGIQLVRWREMPAVVQCDRQI